ncbi:MAG: MCE family protein, partial [Streptomycetales bacterium]
MARQTRNPRGSGGRALLGVLASAISRPAQSRRTATASPAPRDYRVERLVQTVRLRLYGLVFLLVIALLLGLSVAVYRKAFEPVAQVSLRVGHVGTQLFPQSDVKLRGLDVGEVREVSTSGEGATIMLALRPDMVEHIPANVRARLLPKTVFGERYVDLVVPGRPSPRHLQDGDVIAEDRSRVAIELQRVFDDLLPLLRTVQPAKLNATLSTLATALSGRGEQLGANLVRTQHYLEQLNPHLDLLKSDISGMADFADTYADAAPDLVRMLRNLTTTNSTVVDKRADFAAFYRQTSGVAATTRKFLSANEERIITLAEVSEPTLALLARYSPEYPCLLGGLARQHSRIAETFTGGRLHISIEVVRSRDPYEPGEEPRYLASRGPRCYGLPDNPPVPMPGGHVPDGTRPEGHDQQPVPSQGLPAGGHALP